MIRSMTGFARVTGPSKGGWSVEIRSLNHRYFEFSLKVPSSLYGLEDRIREFCQGQIRRGKVTLSISETNPLPFEEVALDEKVLRFYVDALKRIQRRFRLKEELSVSDLLALPRIFSVEKKAGSPEKLWPSVKHLLEKAVKGLVKAKEQEGRTLAKDLLHRVRKIEESASEIEERIQSLPRAHFEKLRDRIQELFKEAVKDERLWQEAVLIAERSDVTEERVRLKSHLELFKRKITMGDEVGRELDFILQEMNREVNTLGAKAQDVGVSREVVFIKAELEKIREQVQNIE